MTGLSKHTMRSKSDSYSYVIDKAMDIEKSMGRQEIIKQNITQHGTSFERGNATNWYNKFLAKCYFEFLCAIAILTLIPLAIILGLNYYSNRTESYVSGYKFLVYDFKGVAPLNNNSVLQQGRHMCDSVPDSFRCHETYLEYDLSGFVFSRLCAEIEKMQGRLIRYEDLLNNEAQLYTKDISEILSGSLKKEILEKDSLVTNVKAVCKKDSADANLEMEHKKNNDEKRESNLMISFK
ncbi:uncharacterized protein Bfra_006332 [Botrytis fragariae]|uniref:Uncharacterized protein n=1 Tax=Botrytis fragariae TaxID=1964551 RepID=A0A8H6B537_9HELO|nr:uncharacterized protein Bfra_006332 [Botrytis fragariae]KAF5879127.1 hypothetical protein Bfra_006332 [Botrytis fragariae]